MTARKSCRYLSCAAATTLTNPTSTNDQFELDESEVWSADVAAIVLPEPKKLRAARKSLRVKSGAVVDRLPKSLPVNIPDWSKILGGEYGRRAAADDDDDDEFGDDAEYEGNDRMPPHEYLARTRGASFSVHEGEGRTLKGRDLSRVRNAIWKQIGFED